MQYAFPAPFSRKLKAAIFKALRRLNWHYGTGELIKIETYGHGVCTALFEWPTTHHCRQIDRRQFRYENGTVYYHGHQSKVTLEERK